MGRIRKKLFLKLRCPDGAPFGIATVAAKATTIDAPFAPIAVITVHSVFSTVHLAHLRFADVLAEVGAYKLCGAYGG